MKRMWINLLILAAVAQLTVAAAPAAGERVALFNGKNLDGWTVLKCEAAVDGGDILIQSGNGLIQTKKMYADFVLEFDWKALGDDKWDSGVYFRYNDVPPNRPWPDRYQANLRKGQEGDVGGIKGATSKGLLKDREWNTFKLTVQGSKLELEINGQQAWKAEGLAGPESGYIALQAEVPGGGQHRFRNIYITELNGAAPKGKGPLKVFILAGQSNMEGAANVSTIDFLGEDKKHAALLKTFKPDGKTLATRDDVWVANRGVYGPLAPGYGARRTDDELGGNIGPEYAFGYFMGEALDDQVLLIKVAAGGTSIYQNWRPPSAGLPEGADPEKFGALYRGMVTYVQQTLKNLKQHFPAYDEKAGYEIAGFVWFQGYNDMFNETGRKEYGANLVHLIKDLRKELKAPDMKVVVGVMGVNGPRNEENPKQKDVRDGQRFVNTVAEFKGNVNAIETAPLLHPKLLEIKCAGWLYPERDLKKNPVTEEEQALLKRATSNKGYHYFGSGRFFILLGKSFAETMQELLKK